MKPLAALLLALAPSAVAESFTGTLTDVMCKEKDQSAHTRECALSCAKSGYGLVLSDGTFLKFDEAGNQKALAALRASSKPKDFKATVSGKREGATVQVESLALE